MNNILVCGLINIETTLKTNGFPIEYSPVEYNFFGVNTSISGVGYNIVKALKTLGNNLYFCSIIGNDMYRDIIINDLKNSNTETKYVLPLLERTVQSGILYDNSRRKIILDLKNIQEINYPIELFGEVIDQIGIGIICNINFSRVFLKALKNKGKLIATDVHVLNDINDEYNNDYIQYSDILFLSNENIQGREKSFIEQLIQRYNHEIVVITMGEKGLLIHTKEKGEIKYFPAIKTREAVNTTGAGDALFSCFIHYYNKTRDPYCSIKLATIFASYKIGEDGGSNGFIAEEQLEKLDRETN